MAEAELTQPLAPVLLVVPEAVLVPEALVVPEAVVVPEGVLRAPAGEVVVVVVPVGNGKVVGLDVDAMADVNNYKVVARTDYYNYCLTNACSAETSQSSYFKSAFFGQV